MSDLIAERSGEVLHLRLHRPNRANALSPALVEQLIDSFEQVDDDVRLIVLSGEGKSFCSGFDLSDISELTDGDLLRRFVRIEQLLQLVHYAPIPVLALAHRYAFGAGADLLACASVRIVAPGTAIRMPGLNFGIVLGTRRLARLIGDARARDILVDTRKVDADEAHAIGLVDDIVDIELWPDLIERTRSRATALSPVAVAAMLDATRVDSRAADMAALVESAASPGLRDRVEQYVQQVNESRSGR